MIKFIFDAIEKKTDLLKIPRSAENAGILENVMNFSAICSRNFLLVFRN